MFREKNASVFIQTHDLKAGRIKSRLKSKYTGTAMLGCFPHKTQLPRSAPNQDTLQPYL